MSELLSQLGIDWRLLLSQAVNFLLLLVVLRIFAYGPLVRLLKERRKKIEEGVAKSEEAERRLHEANSLKALKLKEAESSAVQLLKNAEGEARRAEAKLMEEAKKKEAELLKEAERAAAAKSAEGEAKVRKEAAELVKRALAKTVELRPQEIDAALIEKAVAEAAHTRQ